MHGYSLVDWYRLDGRDRAKVLEAIDAGERVSDERLRPAALAMAKTMANGWGVRKPIPVAITVVILAAAVINLALTGLWWGVVIVILAAFTVSLVIGRHTKHVARRLRPVWLQAVDANQD